MTDEHKKAIAEGRKKYWDKQRENKEHLHECDDCLTIEWYAKQMHIEVDREHCPIKCRYNKEVINDANNE